MDSHGNDNLTLGYEAQARYSPSGDWVTISVRPSRSAAVTATLCSRDPWGRTPTDVRVVAIQSRGAR